MRVWEFRLVDLCIASFLRQVSNTNAGPASVLDSMPMRGKQFFSLLFLKYRSNVQTMSEKEFF